MEQGSSSTASSNNRSLYGHIGNILRHINIQAHNNIVPIEEVLEIAQQILFCAARINLYTGDDFDAVYLLCDKDLQHGLKWMGRLQTLVSEHSTLVSGSLADIDSQAISLIAFNDLQTQISLAAKMFIIYLRIFYTKHRESLNTVEWGLPEGDSATSLYLAAVDIAGNLSSDTRAAMAICFPSIFQLSDISAQLSLASTLQGSLQDLESEQAKRVGELNAPLPMQIVSIR
jgi:hypothetical protein